MPKENGGLGILNLERFARALRLRWLWQEWVSPEKVWLGTKTPCDDIDGLLFAACTTITVGNGKRTSFWHSGWLQGRRTKDIAPSLFKISRPKNRTVAAALERHTWIRDIRRAGGLTLGHVQELLKLWGMLRSTQLQQNQEDQIIWKLTASGKYTAASAYKAQFLGNVKAKRAQAIWKAWAPPKCKFFAWLINQNRVWTSDRLQRRGWPHNPSCPLCRSAPETALHLMADCRFTRRVWSLIASWTAQPTLHPQLWMPSENTLQWCDSLQLSLLVIWEIWCERNARVFRRHETSAPGLFSKIKNEAAAWALAGAKDLESLIRRE
ncbi:hypothetical protein PVAP13_9NG531714 [Panicum virgatum]|uniref:Reverse transcriptase zinc-binding domain-containing protein n=1 Tax=Panicum virgatum TaxID=38727 RepID=A0A8T0MSG7_PANVG|nr:hypothetical protein PVAP13_9NG531714 [Panicum virgatum]